MLSLRRSVLALLVGTLSFAPLTLQASSEKAQDLARIETQGLKSAGNKRLKQLLSQPAAPTGEVQFSRRWIDGQPNTGDDE